LRGLCKNIGFTQLLTRVSQKENNDNYATQWWPNVNTSMIFVKHTDKSQVYKYVLHARHGKYEAPTVSLKNLFGENYQEYLDEATIALEL
jgi:hypothetical protein